MRSSLLKRQRRILQRESPRSVHSQSPAVPVPYLPSPPTRANQPADPQRRSSRPSIRVRRVPAAVGVYNAMSKPGYHSPLRTEVRARRPCPNQPLSHRVTSPPVDSLAPQTATPNSSPQSSVP